MQAAEIASRNEARSKFRYVASGDTNFRMVLCLTDLIFGAIFSGLQSHAICQNQIIKVTLKLHLKSKLISVK